MRRSAPLLAAAVLGLLPAVLPVVVAAPAAASPPVGACSDPPRPQPVIGDLPWAQQLLEPDKVWPYSTGAGVTVAVVDSGVDLDHPQLHAPGKVLPGRDFFLVGTLPGDYDCASHGTAVASIIAADPVAGVGFHGIAPGARILPVRVVDRADDAQGQATQIDPNVVARGIRYAADQGAKVINLSLSGYRDVPAIHDAVVYAQSKDALIVAAAGNRQQGAQASLSYPAAYDGVLGVGAIDIAGARDDESQVGPFVDLVAPGKGVLAAASEGGQEYWEGTSFAAPFVSGAAALVRAAWPQLDAAQVAQRLMATASLARGGAGSQEYGAGVVNPYRAVTEGLSGKPAVLPAVQAAIPDVAALREHAWWSHAGAGAEAGVALVVLAIALAAIAAWAVPRVRRRGWRPARTAPLADVVPREEPPEQIFLFPAPPVER
jgi:type VII secretion-associated serine protease mycosin